MVLGIKRKANIEIWEPLYHRNAVLVAKYKVKKGRNVIKILKGAYKGKYEMSEIAIRSYPVHSNGKIDCFMIPLSKLRRI